MPIDLSLHVLVPPRPELLPRVEEAIAGGVTVVQLRAKDEDDRTAYEVGRELRRLTARLGVALTVDDRLDLALALGADGVHVGQRDLPLEALVRLAPRALTLGLSTHDLDEAAAAWERYGRELDYLGFGPVFPTRSKAAAGEATGVERLAEVCRRSPLPVVAIGGIDAASKDAVFAAGAAGVAVIAAILTAADPRAAAASLRRR